MFYRVTSAPKLYLRRDDTWLDPFVELKASFFPSGVEVKNINHSLVYSSRPRYKNSEPDRKVGRSCFMGDHEFIRFKLSPAAS